MQAPTQVTLEKNGAQTPGKAAEAPVGRSSATERDPSTSDKFNFWLSPEVIVNPFDIVQVGQVAPDNKASKTYGLVTTLEHRTDAPNHLANFISSNFGSLAEEPNTPRQGTTIAKVNVLSNNANVYMPVPNERVVTFADANGIEEALGIDQMELKNRVPAGLISMSNGASAVAYIDRRYVLGPESAHINISGISGLATKTSYAMFIIQSILQKADDPTKIAVIIMNVKQADLLHIDERGPDLPPEEKEKWEKLGLEPKPFEPGKVHYFLPRSKDGIQPNSFFPPSIYTTYAYDLEATADKLDLLFSDVSDPSGTMESIIGDIMIGLQGGQADFKAVRSWMTLLYGPPLFDPTAKKTVRLGDHLGSSVGKFRRHLRRLVHTRQTGIFVESRAINEKVLSAEIGKIKGGHVYVVDIAKLADAEQTLVFGDLLKTVYALKAEAPEEGEEEVPDKIIFFVDELNKYAPSGAKTSPISEQVLDIAERGRSLGVILVSAQQFMSAVHSRVTGNAATKVLGRSGSAEVLQPDYKFLDDDLKLNVTRLNKGELLLSHAIYRQPVKVVFPKPAYRQQQA
ncbi:MAG: ATP-binding protein [Chloroflexi bacterium]|nr:ATP-binding protein [Chloroflexota bacterium]